MISGSYDTAHEYKLQPAERKRLKPESTGDSPVHQVKTTKNTPAHFSPLLVIIESARFNSYSPRYPQKDRAGVVLYNPGMPYFYTFKTASIG